MNTLQVYDKKRTRLEWVCLVAILLLAAYLRLSEPGVVEFKRDEANLSLLALEFADGGKLPLLGIGSSVGVPNAPVNVWVLTIPYLFSSDPQVATGFIGLLNVLACALTYWIGRRYGGPWVGLIAALLYATNPWAVIFSRKIWAQNMLPVFVLATVASGLIGFLEGRRWAQILHFPLLALTGQIHYGAFVIIPVTGVLLIAGRQLTHWRVLGIGVLLAGAVTLPYAVGMNNAGLNTPSAIRAAINATPEAESPQEVITDASVRGAAIVFSGADLHSLAGPQQFQAYLDQVPAVYPLFYILPLLLCLSLVWLLVDMFHFGKNKRFWLYSTLIVWVLFPIVIYTITWTTFFIHYHIPAHAGGYLLIAFALQSFSQSAGRLKHIQPLLTSFFLIVVGIYLLLWGQLLQFVDDRYTPNGFGTPLHYLGDVRSFISSQSDQPGRSVIASVGGQSIGIDDEPTIWKALLFDVGSVQFEDTNARIYPATDAILLDQSCEGMGTVFTLREGNNTCYRVSTRSQDDLDLSGYTQIDASVGSTRFANGAEIIAYQWDAQQCLDIVWRVHAVTEIDYSFAVQFLDGQGELVASGDGPALQGANWRMDDQISQRFCVQMDQESIEAVRLGMYTFDGTNFSNVDLINESGDAVGQQFTLEDL